MADTIGNVTNEQMIVSKFGFGNKVRSIKIKPRGSTDDNYVEIYDPIKKDVITLKSKCGKFEHTNKTAISDHEQNCDKCKSK